MIKVIYGKAGEGIITECIKEIECATDCIRIAILSKGGDFFNRVREFKDTEALKNKDIIFYKIGTSIENALQSKMSYDMFIVEGFTERFEEIASRIPHDKFKRVIITQQLSRDFGEVLDSTPVFIGLSDIAGAYIKDGKIIKNRRGELDDYSGVERKIKEFDKVVVQNGRKVCIYCKLEDMERFTDVVQYARDNNFHKGFSYRYIVDNK